MASTIYWPSRLAPGDPRLLPMALLSGYGFQGGSAVLRTQLGPATLARQIYSDARVALTVAFSFSAAQWFYFDHFFKYDLAFGTQWFWMPLRLSGVLELHEVMFTGEPGGSIQGRRNGSFTAQMVTRKGVGISLEDWNDIKESPDPMAAIQLLIDL